MKISQMADLRTQTRQLLLSYYILTFFVLYPSGFRTLARHKYIDIHILIERSC